MFGIRKGIRRLVKRNEAAPAKPQPRATPERRPTPQPRREDVVAAAPAVGSIAAALVSQTEAQHKAAPAAEPAQQLTGIAAMIAAGAMNNTEGNVDLSVSYTSGPAAEAAARAMSERDMLQVTEDGTSYWGPVDNESARAKAEGLELIIDQEECIHCGTCVENTEQVFALPDDAKAVVVAQEGPMELIQDAIDACPVTCIHWTEEPEQFPQLNDVEGRPVPGTTAVSGS
jgi:ferredoxin